MKKFAKQPDSFSPKMQKIFNWYLAITVIIFLMSFSTGIATAVGMFIVLWGLFGIVAGIFKRGATRDKRIGVAVLGLALFFIGGAILPETDKSSALPSANASLVESTQTIDKSVTPKAYPVSDSSLKLYKVTSITDGDTIKVNIDGKIETIRFIGIDTPETKDFSKPVQCYGKEASSKMQSFAQSKSVALESDSTQGDRDKYNRLLRYVFLEDGSNVGLEMIKGGYAHEYTYNKPYKYKAEFTEAQNQAKTASAGFWSPSTCGGNTTLAANAPKASTPTPAVVAPAPAPRPIANPVPAPAPVPPPAPVSSDYFANCTEVRAAGRAPIYPGQPGFRDAFDRDNDGIGCE